jgi:hypothetical protein
MAGLVAATAPVAVIDPPVPSAPLAFEPMPPPEAVEAALPSPEPAEMPPDIGDPFTRGEWSGPDGSTTVVVRKGPPPEAAVGDTDPEDPDYNHEGLSPEDKEEREAVEAQAREDSDEMAKEVRIAEEAHNAPDAVAKRERDRFERRKELKRLADEADQRRFEGRATEADKEKSAVDYMAEAGMPDERNWAAGRAYAHLMTEKTKTSINGRSKNREGAPGTFTYKRTPKRAAVGDLVRTGARGYLRVAVPHPTEPGLVAWLSCNAEGDVIGKAGAGATPITPAAAKAASEVSGPFPEKAEPTPFERFYAELGAVEGASEFPDLLRKWKPHVDGLDDAEKDDFRESFLARQTELHAAKKAELAAKRAASA